MKKIILIIVTISILYLSIVNALDECRGTMNDNEVPCVIFLPINISDTACNTINVSFYLNSTYLESHFMIEHNSFTCFNNFTQTNWGTYTFFYSTGDSGSITIEEDVDNRYYLYVVVALAFFILLGLGFYLQDGTFSIIAGMLCAVIAIDLFMNGFPGLTNEFLKNGITIVLVGISFYFIIAPTVEFFENFKGTFGGKLD